MVKINDLVSRLLIAWGAAWIVFIGIMGTWLHDAEYPIKGLVTSGHSHAMSFAFGAIFAGLVIRKFVSLSKVWHWILLLLVVVSLLLPLGLIIGGMGGNPGTWMDVTSALGGWGFVTYWLILGLVALFWKDKKSE